MQTKQNSLPNWLKVLPGLIIALLLAVCAWLYQVQERVLREAAEQERSVMSRRFQQEHGYTDILQVGLKGRVRSGLNGDREMPAGYPALFAEALNKKRPVFTPLQGDHDGSHPRISPAAPIVTGTGHERKLMGAFNLVGNTADFLFSLIRSCSTPGKIVETMPVVRDRDDVPVVSDLQHRSSETPRLRVPLIDTNTPAVTAVSRIQEVVRGKDCRGGEILATVAPIFDSPRFIETQIDAATVFAKGYFRPYLIRSS